MPAAKKTVKFIKKIQRTYDVYSFYFEKPEDFDYTAGQYNRWIIPIENPDERGNTRYFTICSAPSEKDYLMITTKISISSFKKTLVKMLPGQEIEIFGPLGVFTLGDPALHHIFIAGGIGITPYRSMITEAAATGWNTPITLFASYTTTEDVVFQEEFTAIAQNKPWFRYFPTVTKPEESKKPWEGLTGRVDNIMITKQVPDTANCIFYLCGPPAMTDALNKTVVEMGITEERTKTEKFAGY